MVMVFQSVGAALVRRRPGADGLSSTNQCPVDSVDLVGWKAAPFRMITKAGASWAQRRKYRRRTCAPVDAYHDALNIEYNTE